MKQVFTTGQVAKLCRVAPRTVSKWFDSGKLRGYRIPGKMNRRIPRANLIKFLTESGLPLAGLVEEEVCKILLIGTNTAFNDRLKSLLQAPEKYQYAITDKIFEAGMLMHTFRPDLIVVDFAIGRCESVGIAAKLREDEVYTQLPIIALAWEDEAAPDKLKEYGFREVYQKPFDTVLLGETIRSIAESKWAE